MKKYVCFFTGEFINPSNTKKTKQKNPPQKHALSYRSHMTCLCKFCYNYLVYYSYMNSLGEKPKDMFFCFHFVLSDVFIHFTEDQDTNLLEFQFQLNNNNNNKTLKLVSKTQFQIRNP